MKPKISSIPFIFARAQALLKAGATVVALIFAAHCFVASAAQKSRKPLIKNDVIQLLEGEVAPARVAEVARTEGITFEMTQATEKDLRDAGATEDLLRALRKLAPKHASETDASSDAAASSGSPILLIEATPGGAQVYLDDEPKATTSPQGRVRFSQIAAGEHVVRLSLAGYSDYEQKVQLKPGQTFTVSATLEAAKPLGAAAARSNTSPTETQTASSPATASLGLIVAPYEGPNGEKGAYISGVSPNGPAQRAGLRFGYAILSIDGQNVTSPGILISTLAGHRPGDTVQITYTTSPATGTPVLTTRVQLASRETVNSGLANLATFLVAHDHGFPAGQNLCIGWMTVDNGMIHFQGQRGVTQGRLGGPMHSFEFPVAEIKEARKNGVYLAAMGGFHIRLKKGANNNFFVIDAQGRYQPSDTLLSAIDRAMANQ